MMLATRLLWRNWRSGELRILTAALVLAVAVVTAVAVFASRMEHSLIRESNSYLAADRVVSGRFEVPQAWRSAATEQGLQQAETAQFSAMIYAGDEMVLASVKAVSHDYPLRGVLEVANAPFAMGAAIRTTTDVPAPGEAWVDSRLLPLLHLQLGQTVAVGDKTLVVRQILIREPDAGAGFSVMGPRLLMNQVDLPETGMIQPGSRVSYRWLLAGDDAQLDAFTVWLTPQLEPHYQLMGLKDAQKDLSSALARGSRFLLLAGMIGVLLAGVAIAIAAQQFAARHVDQVALMKSLGASAWRIRRLYISQLLMLAGMAAVFGVVVGEGIQMLIARAIASLFQVALTGADPLAYLAGAATAIVCLLGFALPPLWHLPTVPPIKVLRRELMVRAAAVWVRGLAGIAALVLLIALYSGDLRLTTAVVAGLGGLVMANGVVAWLLLRAGRRIGQHAGSVWRLALARLERHPAQSITQMMVFACALMLLMVLFTVRTSLIQEWRMQLPEDAPNHFVVNVAPQEVAPLTALLTQKSVAVPPFFPMTLGRLTAINDDAIDEARRDKSNTLRRELNLSWTATLADDNRIVAGQWWGRWTPQHAGMPGVSVEEKTAKELGITLGDVLTFSLGGLDLTAEVASLRTLEWNSMRPNFFFLFSPGALDGFTVTYMTSIYLAPDQKPVLNDVLHAFPTVVVIETDRIIERIRTIVEQVSRGMALVLWLVLAGGVLVLVAAVSASMAGRQLEAGLLRALGSGRRLILGSIGIEFATLGVFAGLLGALGAEVLLATVQTWVFEQHWTIHVVNWVMGPVVGALLIGGLGVWSCRRVVTVPPAIVLREIQG